MTGTSMDGIDIAICDFWEKEDKPKYDVVAYKSFPMPFILQEVFSKMLKKKRFARDFSQYSVYFANILAEHLEEVCELSNIDIKSIDAIGAHGQTIWHEPKMLEAKGFVARSTWQLLNGPTLAAITQIPVVYDFRSADVALGGQGAPLVPIFDYHFLSQKNEYVIALNIGGMANITVLPPNQNIDNVMAFDTGPGNILIDGAMQYLYNQPFDENGSVGARGEIKKGLIDDLKEIAYPILPPPKSTGREVFDMEMVKRYIEQKKIIERKKPDYIATFTEYTAWSIAYNIIKFADSFATIYASGGGIRNKFLMQRLQTHLPNAKIISSEAIGIDPDAKEAICFAYLAWLRLEQKVGNICSVTGASRRIVLGSLALG